MPRNKMLFLEYLAVLASLILAGDTQNNPIPTNAEQATNIPMDPPVYDQAPYYVQTSRPMPPELEDMFKNEGDDHTTFCLKEFGVCISAETQDPLCAINSTGEKKMFPNICDMILQNCRSLTENWRYYNDDKYCKDSVRSKTRNMKAIARILKRNNGPVNIRSPPSAPAPWAFFDA